MSKAAVTTLVQSLGGTCNYSGKEKTMYIKAKILAGGGIDKKNK